MNKVDWNKIFRLLVPSFYYLALLLIPLGMSYLFPVFSPFTMVKSTYLQILTALILLFLLISFGFWRQPIPGFLKSARYRRALLPVLIFWSALALLSIWSFNPLQSWFGSYDRQLGLFFYFSLLIWYAFILYYFGGFRRPRAEGGAVIAWQTGVKNSALLMALSGALIGIYAFLQFCGYDFAIWQESQLYSRAISTLGQPNFLGSFLLFSLAMSVYYFFSSQNFWWKFLAVFLFVWQFVGLIVSGSRSAWLAAIVVSSLVILILLWQRWLFRTLLFVTAFLTVILSIFYIFMPTRLSSLVDFNSGSLVLRQYFYQAAIPVISEHPWLGVGLENGGEVIVSQYQPEWGTLMRVDAYTDKVHNSILDVIIQTGSIGLLFWLGLYLFWAWQCWRLWLKPAGRKFALAAGAAMLAYSISLFFGIADLTSIFYLWILAALVSAGNLSLAGESTFSLKEKFSYLKNNVFKFLKLSSQFKIIIFRVISALLALLALAQIYLAANSLQADYYFLQIYKTLPSRQYPTVEVLFSYLDKLSFNPIARNYYQRFFSTYALSDFENIEDLSTKLLVKAHLLKNFQQLPATDYENKLVLARLSCFFEEDERAQAIFQELIDFSPWRPVVYRDFAQCLENQERPLVALKAYGRALEVLPSLHDEKLNQDHRNYLYFYTSRLHLAQAKIYKSQGELGLALNLFQQAAGEYPDDIEPWQRMADIYVLQRDYPQSISLFKHLSIVQPWSTTWPLSLSNIYRLTGEDELANVYLKQADNLIPTQSLNK